MNNEKRVRYTKSPLLEVIFQLRFPTILTISATAPTAFQEHLRTEFPFYREEIEQQNEVTIDINGNSSTIKRRQIKNHTFLSTDKRWKVNLTSSFLAISTTAYTQWEDFTKRCFDIVDKFEEVYAPSFYTITATCLWTTRSEIAFERIYNILWLRWEPVEQSLIKKENDNNACGILATGVITVN